MPSTRPPSRAHAGRPSPAFPAQQRLDRPGPLPRIGAGIRPAQPYRMDHWGGSDPGDRRKGDHITLKERAEYGAKGGRGRKAIVVNNGFGRGSANRSATSFEPNEVRTGPENDGDHITVVSRGSAKRR